MYFSQVRQYVLLQLCDNLFQKVYRKLLRSWRKLLTLEGSGLTGKRAAPRRNASGAGLPRFTSGSESIITKWSKRSKNSLCRSDLSWKLLSWEPVTTARGILFLWRCRTSLSAPVNIFSYWKSASKVQSIVFSTCKQTVHFLVHEMNVRDLDVPNGVIVRENRMAWCSHSTLYTPPSFPMIYSGNRCTLLGEYSEF